MPKTKTTVTTVTQDPAMSSEETPQTQIAVIKNDLKHMGETLVRVESMLSTAITNFVTKSDLSKAKAQSDIIHLDFDKRISKLENWNSWIVRTVFFVIIVSLLGFLITTKSGVLK